MPQNHFPAAEGGADGISDLRTGGRGKSCAFKQTEWAKRSRISITVQPAGACAVKALNGYQSTELGEETWVWTEEGGSEGLLRRWWLRPG